MIKETVLYRTIHYLWPRGNIQILFLPDFLQSVVPSSSVVSKLEVKKRGL